LESRSTVFITFIELAFNAGWQELPRSEWETFMDSRVMGTFLPEGWMLFRALRGAELQLVEPESTRKWMEFKDGALVAVGFQMIRYYDKDFESELSVDEKKQMGK
jgi:hypothetical protein